MPEDEDEDEDSSFAEGFADLSESDNVPYDLTGKKETFKRYIFYYISFSMSSLQETFKRYIFNIVWVKKILGGQEPPVRQWDQE